jgi:hypothetical protein
MDWLKTTTPAENAPFSGNFQPALAKAMAYI